MRILFRSKELVLGMTVVKRRHIMWLKTGVLIQHKQWVRIPIEVGRKLRRIAVQDRNIKRMMEG
jgi:hypothetical protein